MADLSKNDGRKESDNRDKSMHGLVVALAMAGTIAGSVILFAYASSNGSTAGAEAASQPLAEPEPIILEKVVEKPVYMYVNQTEDDAPAVKQEENEQKEKGWKDNGDSDKPKLKDLIPERALDLLNEITYGDDDKEGDDDGERGGRGHDRDDDDDD